MTPGEHSAHDVHGICDSFVDDLAGLHPILATEAGITGHDDRLPDLSPEGHQARAELIETALAKVRVAEPADDGERVAKAVFLERIGLQAELHAAGLPAAELGVLGSPVQAVRDVFDVMPAETAEDWAVVATRLAAVPSALAGYRTSLLTSADRGIVSARRQVIKAAEQCDTWTGRSGEPPFFASFVEAARGVPGVSEGLRADLEAGARGATEAYAELGKFLRDELADRAPTEDAVGEETYRLWSREFLGARVDPREAYEWGWAEFARLEREAERVAERISPGAGLAGAAEALDNDPRYQVRGQRRFAEWMQRLSDAAVAAVRGVHFEIPDELARLECRIAPPGGTLGAYYTGPAEDFSRPGRMWWAVASDREVFSTWREVTTVYHEGVPGHHLQIGTSVYETGLNRFQRLLALTSGLAEGWALYAEQLMREFGFLDDDGDLLGLLDAQLFRAARVIIDIGMHLKLEIPAGTGFHEGERWTPELGTEFMLTRTLTEPAIVYDEIDRYLGWPGQAPAYKLGERLWLAAREEHRARKGAAFDLKDFHMRALRLGGMGLDTLRERLAEL